VTTTVTTNATSSAFCRTRSGSMLPSGRRTGGAASAVAARLWLARVT